ncbi:hypothetical protein MMC21_003898 [Puttea exsequens]|nr:hypothetical protein [Puttea exsequens]
MEPLTLKPRKPVEDDIECWDDDEDLQGIDDLHLRNVSSTTFGSGSHHRDSLSSSRMSTRSDQDSVGGGDEDWQVLLPAQDEKSIADAVKSAKTAGIPIPNNVPASALLGGTLKRMGGRRVKKMLGDDWGEDIELPKAQEGGLTLKKMEAKDFTDSLRQFSAEFPSSPKTSNPPKSSMTFMERMASATKPKPNIPSLDKFRDDEDDDFFGDVPTIKVAKNRPPQKIINFIPPPEKTSKEAEKIEDDLEFPDDGKPLRLSTKNTTPKTPLHDDLDMEWAEGSLGTRFGGTRRDARSNPSSSVSAFSPSASSCLTGESEDEGLEGLVLPDAPLASKFEEAKKKRLEKTSSEPLIEQLEKPARSVGKTANAEDDFISGLEIGDGEVFDSGKLTLNRNVKHKALKSTSPVRRPATTLTFTNKLEPGFSKIPRPQPSRATLEPVLESGGPVPHYRRSGSRIGGHSAQSSLSAIPTPSTPSSHSVAPSTPSRKLNTKSSRDTMKSEPTTTSAQYLRAKRSAPVMRSQPSPARSQTSYQRPPSRGGDHGSRQGLPSRPKTPVERLGAESSLANSRKVPVPFLPAGTSHAQSHHISIKSSRNFRPGSSDSNESAPVNRPISRLANAYQRPTTPTGRRGIAPDSLIREAAAKRTLKQPLRRRGFGDGNELDAFDDLPTSASSESRFTKQPVPRNAPKSVQMRSRLGLQSQNTSTTSVNEIPPPATPSTPLSPLKQEHTPRFARDTNASRLAREQRIGSVAAALQGTPTLPTVRETGGPLMSINSNRKPPLQQQRGNPLAPTQPKRAKKQIKKPALITSIGKGVASLSPEMLKDMRWNPITDTWEGNENALAPFDVPVSATAAPVSPKSPSGGKREPALIANVGAGQGVQVSGGMVFDPQRMCWLKMAPRPGAHRSRSNSNPMSPDPMDDEDDPFAGLDDLEDGSKAPKANDDVLSGSTAVKNKGLVEDEWLVGEEFDVGPEFVRRQRAEEERWRAKVEGWVGAGVMRDEGVGQLSWKWAIRGKVDDLL